MRKLVATLTTLLTAIAIYDLPHAPDKVVVEVGEARFVVPRDRLEDERTLDAIVEQLTKGATRASR